MFQQRMGARLRREHEAAEAARIVEPQRAAVGEQHVDVIVQAALEGGRQIAQAARHAEMHEQRAGVRAEQQVLAAPLEPIDARTFQRARQALRNGPPKPRLANLDAGNRAANHVRRKPAARGFDFGQLRHRASLRRAFLRTKSQVFVTWRT